LLVTNSRFHRTLTLCVVSIAALGQTARKPSPKASAGDHKLVAVRVTGTQRYSSEEIIAATGLEIGAVAAEEDFQKAAQRLGECGFFSNVSYSYAYSPAGIKLDLDLADSDKLVPAHFENFVWFSNEELVVKIHEHLALFKGQVPIGGNLSDQVSDILQAVLVQHSLSARADYIRESKQNEGPIDSVNFRASGMNLRIQEVRFPGAGPDELPALAAEANKLVGTDYLRSDLEVFANAHLLPVYLERGFLKASISEPQAKVVQETADETQVAVQFPVAPGIQYKLSGIEWAGNTAFPTDRLQSLIHARPGQAANAFELKTDLESVHKLYGTAGYMTASVKDQPQFDDATRSVAYRLEVQEGDVFHLGDLDIQGLDPKTVDRLRDSWTLRETDPYDTTYPRRFFEQTVKLLERNITWTISIHEGVNEKEKTVDVTLRYALKPSS
jgi:outer membrane protein assembly factor BamA